MSVRGKFIPGLVAYITADGRLISHSQNAEILVNIFENIMLAARGGNFDDESHVIGSLQIDAKDITYVAHVSRTDDPRVYAVAAVTMLAWMGRNDFNMLKMAMAGILGMLICLVALFLLRGAVIAPLQALAAQVNTLRWGKEVPREDIMGKPMRVDEISSLEKAIHDLAFRMVEKEELEKRYVGDIIKAQEDERGRIARDIHDGPIQVASALIQRVQIASITPGGLPGETQSELSRAESIAHDLVEDLRDICDSLVPPWVSLGLPSCMDEAASRFERQYSITINMNVDQSLSLPLEYTLALFRIFQEAVSNAVRHGGATEVTVEARAAENGRSVVFSLSDNGVGFDMSSKPVESLVRSGKRGINGMRQRTELLGGACEITSSAGAGTKITVTS
jgi:signal transduction histidine kinase